MTELVIYEQPLSEYINICLRLEGLFQRIERIFQSPTELNIAVALEQFIAILALTERSDLKSRLAQALNSQLNKLQQFERNPDVDGSILSHYIDVIKNHAEQLSTLDGRIGQSLRDIPLLRLMHQQLNTPGGISIHMVPAYQLWLQQPLLERINMLKKWLEEIAFLYKINQSLLSGCRDQQAMMPIKAINGFHQQSLNTSPQVVMIRVGILKGEQRFAVTSVGKHRLSITFYQNKIHEGRQIHERDPNDFLFYLACCH
ncbi:MAG: cell division protein ZapD [Candidatus Comchoanobacterales bacterium]